LLFTIKTAAENLKQYSPPVFKRVTSPNLEIQIRKDAPSASSMVWRKLFPGKDLPFFMKVIEKMDRSKIMLREDFEEAALIDSKSIHSIRDTFKTCNELCQMTRNDMVQKGKWIYAEQKKKIEKLKNTIMYTKLEILPNFPAIRVPVVNANVRDFGRPATKFLQELGDKEGSGIAFAWYKTKDKDSIVMSIRSRGIPDASAVAKYFSKDEDGITGGGSSIMAAVTFPSYEIFEKTMHIRSYPDFTANNTKTNNRPVRTNSTPCFH